MSGRRSENERQSHSQRQRCNGWRSTNARHFASEYCPLARAYASSVAPDAVMAGNGRGSNRQWREVKKMAEDPCGTVR